MKKLVGEVFEEKLAGGALLGFGFCLVVIVAGFVFLGITTVQNSDRYVTARLVPNTDEPVVIQGASLEYYSCWNSVGDGCVSRLVVRGSLDGRSFSCDVARSENKRCLFDDGVSYVILGKSNEVRAEYGACLK